MNRLTILRPAWWRNTPVWICLVCMFCGASASAQRYGSGLGGVIEDGAAVVVGGNAYTRLNTTVDPKTLYRCRPGDDTLTPIWTSEHVFNYVSTSSDGSVIALIEFVSIRSDLPAAGAECALRLVDLEGRTLKSLHGVYDYSWSPEGRRIAYVSGDHYEGGRGFLATGVWLLDVDSGEIRKINEVGFYVKWAKHDGRIYIEGPDGIVAFDPTTERTEPTTVKGLRFSPNGEYYYRRASEGGPFRIFDASSDEDITDQFAIFAVESTIKRMRHIQPYLWLDDTSFVFPTPWWGVEGRRKNLGYVFSVATGELRQLRGETIIGTTDDREKPVIAIDRDGMFQTLDLDAMPEISPEILEEKSSLVDMGR